MNPGSISRVVVADKVAAVQRMLDGIRTIPLDNLAAFTADGRMVAAGDSYLRRALEALLDLARHVLAKGFGRAPAEYGEVARQLGEVGVVNSELAARRRHRSRHRRCDKLAGGSPRSCERRRVTGGGRHGDGTRICESTLVT